MIFTETRLKGAYTIELEKKWDERGFFARSWCQKEFANHDLLRPIVQANISWNKKKGTLRGMHYQAAPYEESKLIRCVRGSIYDVILDMREGSPTFGEWLGFELSSRNGKMLFVPGGFAVGYQTLEDDTETAYQVSEFYTPEAERGIRYNDPRFGVQWPIPVEVISEKDRNWPDYQR